VGSQMMMQTERANQGMDLGEVLGVLADLAEAGCAVWVAGGWGVDALVGRQTRLHRDLDLALDARNETVALRVLARRGYRVETDWRPVRVELIAEGRGWVDVHPVVFDATGHGRQADLGGGQFDYPPDAFDLGSLGGVRVPCLSRDQQLLFHTGYEPRAIDLLDLALLERLTSRG
jgi:lincosamide nucleotidyltransferase A/C/D/E